MRKGGYNLTVVLYSLDRLRDACGSGNVQLTQEIIQKHYDELLEIDRLGPHYEGFKAEIADEYQAYRAGDFSYQHVLHDTKDPGADESRDGLSEAEKEKLLQALMSGDDASARTLVEEILGDSLEGERWGDFDVEPFRELTAACAVADILLGRKMDPSFGFKYGYALLVICEHLGRVLPVDAWCGIRAKSVDRLLKMIPPLAEGGLSVPKLLYRGAPVAIPEPEDVPFLGYARWQEVSPLQSGVQAAYRNCSLIPERGWEVQALSNLLNWADQAITSEEDLLFFYF